MAKILVTGCAGFIGSHVCERLLAAGHVVTGIDRMHPGYSIEQKLQNLESVEAHPFFTFHLLDLVHIHDYQGIQVPDLVVHLAGRTGVRDSMRDAGPYFRDNYHTTLTLLEWMRKHSVWKMIFASSSSVYGGSRMPFTEDQRIGKPVSPYGQSKLNAEHAINFCQSKFGLDLINLRYFSVYGPRQRPDMAIHTFTRQILAGEALVLNHPESARDYTYVGDVVDGTLRAIDFLLRNAKVAETINIGTGRTVTLRKLIETLEAVLETKATIREEGLKPGDLHITHANIQKAIAILDYHPEMSLEGGIKAFVEWYRQYILVGAENGDFRAGSTL